MRCRKPVKGPTRLALAALTAFVVLLAPAGGRAQPANQSLPSQQSAELGVEFPSLSRLKYYTRAAIDDIRDNLHASYVRTGWLPNWVRRDRIPWAREDDAMRRLCRNGLDVMIITPGPDGDAKGEDDLYRNIAQFFARYSRRNPGCIRYAELANEADLPQNGFADVQAYARYYERVAPIVARHGIPVLTSGTSGKDLPWTLALAKILHDASPRPPVDGFGFHPYGVSPANMAEAVREMHDAAVQGYGGAGAPPVYVTEIGEKNPADLYHTIVNLAHVTPAITLFEYDAQPEDESGYALKSNPALYHAAQEAWRRVTPGG
jgi:hypothetical protein